MPRHSMISWYYFNSHPHKEDDFSGNRCRILIVHFNSHPHKEDDAVAPAVASQKLISTHILTKRMTGTHAASSLCMVFQLTSSRRGWRSWCCSYELCNCISTHILTKRMTLSPFFKMYVKIFQLTSSQRGWLFAYFSLFWIKTFQLTSSRRGWHWKHLQAIQKSEISTHILTKRMTDDIEKSKAAPYISTHILTKRMTVISRLFAKSIIYFNSHPHEEDDSASDISPHILVIFQLTSSRRGWQPHPESRMVNLYFNSHPHEEDDDHTRPELRRKWNFNSHPHEEDDNGDGARSAVENDFNSHPHEEDDCGWVEKGQDAGDFNSHPHEEDDAT